MKITHLFFLLGIALFAACNDDDTATPKNILSYDYGNVSGPLLDAGEHELAVRFPASTMADHVGKKLTEVQVFVGNLPQACLIRIYGAGNTSTPGQKLYEGNVLNAITSGQWNNFKITPGIAITGEDLWIGVYVEHAQQQQSIGCDSGPRQTNGDWLFSGSDQDWKTYQERTNEAVNWNIRGKVE
ncbi:MAG: hypothetical protein IPM82_05865 [Saprospiraceae bacterium]|nr:hypothetical protein [Saprospiraceae bacterium]